MKTAKHLLGDKGNDIWSVGPDDSVFAAIQLMAEKEVGALMVMQEEVLVGIISERDYARKIILSGLSSKQTPVRNIMTARVLYARPEQSVHECMAMMSDKRIRHLPVVEGERVLGMISIGDLVKAIISEQQHTIEQLEQYISG